MNYYNDFDKGAAAWLRELIKAGLIPNGYVDDRSITDVTPSDLEGFTQCHFFAGIGGWSYALQLAGVPSSTRLWTGSPPCQPFSVAGKQLGQLDERHLAPTFMRLVAQCRPPVLFGEQVAAAIGKHWLDDLFTELEREGYACGAAVLPAASVGAPHKRDRLFFGAVNGLAYASGGSMADTDNARSQGRCGVPERADQQPAWAAGVDGCVGNSYGTECAPRELQRIRNETQSEQSAQSMLSDATSAHHGFWSDADWLGCRDGKFRPVEARDESLAYGFPGGMGCSSDPSLRKAIEEIGFPLGTNIPARVARLRGYGNAIVPQVASEFITAFTGAVTDAGN